jgi:hypothetical protein
MSQNSVQAFNQIKNDGTLSKRQTQVYEAFSPRLGGKVSLTGNEISQKVGIPGLWKRCSELVKLGYLAENGTRVCSVTGKKATAYVLTGKVPGVQQVTSSDTVSATATP